MSNEISKDLSPCPFCGGSAYFGGIDDENHPDFDGRFIGCKKCGCATRLAFPAMDDPYPALIDAWNTRASPAGGWRPIETAPKDGTLVDILRVDGRRFIEMKWNGSGWNDADGFYYPLDGHRYTHWQPLPAPPEPQSQEK